MNQSNLSILPRAMVILILVSTLFLSNMLLSMSSVQQEFPLLVTAEQVEQTLYESVALGGRLGIKQVPVPCPDPPCECDICYLLPPIVSEEEDETHNTPDVPIECLYWSGVGAPVVGVSTPISAYSIDLFHGHKVENVTDLRIPMVGDDFTLTRRYSSKPNFQSNGLVGNRWTSSSLEFISVVEDETECTIDLKSGGYKLRATADPESEECPPQVPLPGGNTMQWVRGGVEHEGKMIPIWRLVDPGRGYKEYFRINGSDEEPGENWHAVDSVDGTEYLAGLLFRERDAFGNTRRYDYVVLQGVNQGNSSTRLNTIYINESSTAAEVEIRYDWYLDLDAPASYGRLRSVEVHRRIDQETVFTDEVIYTYMQEGDLAYSPDLGRNGDLVQVIKRTRVDAGPDEDFEVDPNDAIDQWRVHVTQYRYHNGAGASTGAASYTWDGQSHQLKMVILPEQIEYAYVERLVARGSQDPTNILAQAVSLLMLDDDDDAFGSTKIVDLAAKVIEEYESSGGGRVLRQHVQVGCGCGGASTQGLTLDYEYFSYDNDSGRTTKITESSGAIVKRAVHYDTEILAGVPYLRTEAIVVGSDQWVTHYHYTDDQQVSRIITPSALDSYTPASTNTAPQYAAKTNSGLVHAYAYDENRYRTEVRVGEGDLGANIENYILISRIEYDQNRPHRVSRIDRFRKDDGNDDPEHMESTKFSYGYHTQSGEDVAWIKTEVEAESLDENGPSVEWYASYELFDERGNNLWSRSADGSLTYRTFDAVTGAVLTVVRNAEDDLPATHGVENPLSTTGWGDRYADGGSLEMVFERDPMGRVRAHTSPAGVKTYTLREMRPFPARSNALFYAEITLPHEIEAGSSYGGPAHITWFNAAGSVIGSSEYTIGENGYTAIGTAEEELPYQRIFADYDLDEEVARSVTHHHLTGAVLVKQHWHHVAIDNFHVTIYEYDEFGRLETVTKPNGTIEKSVYDAHDRVIEQLVGTQSSSPNMNTVTEYFYDGEFDGQGDPQQGVGNGNLTIVRQHVGDGTHRDTRFVYDFRDRRIWTVNPLPPHQHVEYDNLGRPVTQAVYSEEPSGIDPPAQSAPGRLTMTEYSQRGLPFKQSVAIDPSQSSPDFLHTYTWYDEVGRTIGTWGPSGPMTLTNYDGLGRTSIVYQVAGGLFDHGDIYNDYETLADLVRVIEQTEYRYIPETGQFDLSTTRRRLHDVADGLPGALTDTNSISTYSGQEYDAAGRVIRSINFGTRHEDGFAAASYGQGNTPPTVSVVNGLQVFDPETGLDDIATLTVYDDRGRVFETIDPEGQVTRYLYDDLDRQIAIVENAVSEVELQWHSSGHWTVTTWDNDPADQNRVTSFAYDGVGNLIAQVSHQADGGNDDFQVTKYIYGVDQSAPDPVAVSNDLLLKVIYPPGQSTTQPEHQEVLYTYNRLGEVVKLQDQNDTVHAYERDGLGRIVVDHIAAFGQGIDDLIDAIETVYDDFGRREAVRSYSDYAGTPVVENAVGFTYDSMWRTERVYQQHDGDVDGNSLWVGYDYDDDVAGNTSRLVELIYPEEIPLLYSYGGSGSINDAISRIRTIDLQAGIHYDYVGMGITAVVDFDTPNVQLDRTAKSAGERVFRTYSHHSGLYGGYDRFGRVQRQMWVDGAFMPWDPQQSLHTDSTKPHVPPIVEITHDYDQASNRLSRHNVTPTIDWDHRHEDFDYDGLHRLEEATRGEWNGSFTHSTDQPSQKWSLDGRGNWAEFAKWDGQDYGDVEERDHTDVNEVLKRMIGTDEFEFTYDHAGNLRTQEVPGSQGAVTITYTHDAWNRLVKIEYGSSLRAEYRYNGLNWRVVKRADTQPDGTINQQRVMYYSANWQLLEERIDDDWSPPEQQSSQDDRKMQYFWGPRYIDDIVARREISLGPPGTLTWYHLTDAQFSTVAIIDDNAALVERVSYDAYGGARHHRGADLTGNGGVNVFDFNALNANWGNYGVGDLDRNGIVNVFDMLILNAQWGQPALPPGQLSSGGTDNIIGYAGYVFNAEHALGGLYLARHRVYSPDLGRWITRDPIGYVDGMGLYEYVRSSPLLNTDPFGLQASVTYHPLVRPHLFCRRPPPRTAQECCDEARSRGLASTDLGGVICCDGRKVSCVWEISNPTGDDTTDGIIRLCIKRHEDKHHGHVPDCPPSGISRPPWRPGMSPDRGECEAYKAELVCLRTNMHKCRSAPDPDACRTRVQDEIILVFRRIHYHCGRVRSP